MKKMKKIMAAALAMMTFSTAAAVTGTVAWFTANNIVSASGMQIQADTEEGIVISNESKSTWKTSVAASHDGGSEKFVPTSTKTTAAWYHGYADDVNDGQSGVVYTTITPADTNNTVNPVPAENDGVFGFKEGSAWKNVYLLNKFYIQSSAAQITGQDIYLQDLTATVSDSAPAQALSRALRVAVKCGSQDAVIFAPVASATTTYIVHTDGSTTAILGSATTGSNTNIVADNVTIPAYAADGTGALEFNVYIYFEGEDEACKSANIPAVALERMSVSFKLGNKAN